MVMKKLRFLAVGLCLILCSTASAQLTVEEALKKIRAYAFAVFFIPLKATYQEDTYTYYSPSQIISYLPDGKVIVKQETLKVNELDPFTRSLRQEDFITSVAVYDHKIDMAVIHRRTSDTLYLCYRRYRLQQHDVQKGFRATTLFDGDHTYQLLQSTRPDAIPVAYKYKGKSPGITAPLGYTYIRRKLDNFDSYALELEGDLYKLTCHREDSVQEFWFDPEKRYTVRKFRLRTGEQVLVESNVSNMVNVHGLILPANVEYATYSKDGKPMFRYRASNISWDQVRDIEEKFKLAFPEGVKVREGHLK